MGIAMFSRGERGVIAMRLRAVFVDDNLMLAPKVRNRGVDNNLRCGRAKKE